MCKEIDPCEKMEPYLTGKNLLRVMRIQMRCARDGEIQLGYLSNLRRAIIMAIIEKKDSGSFTMKDIADYLFRQRGVSVVRLKKKRTEPQSLRELITPEQTINENVVLRHLQSIQTEWYANKLPKSLRLIRDRNGKRWVIEILKGEKDTQNQ